MSELERLLHSRRILLYQKSVLAWTKQNCTSEKAVFVTWKPSYFFLVEHFLEVFSHGRSPFLRLVRVAS